MANGLRSIDMSSWKNLCKVASYPFRHPGRTLNGLGKTAKTTVVGGAAAYVGWEKLTTDKSLTRIVGDAVVGEKAMDKAGETLGDIGAMKDRATDAVRSVSDAMNDMDSQWSGMTKFFRGLFSGNGIGMFGDFFRNLSRGDVSGLGIVGLVTASYLAFGRFGWLGRVAGAILGMMVIGNNFNMTRLPQQRQETLQTAMEPADERQTGGGMRR